MGTPTDIAKQLKWQNPSKFRVSIHPTGSKSSSYLSFDNNKLAAAITSIQLPDFNSTPIEEWIGEEWRFATGRLENYQVSITMKDYDNFTLYKKWTKAMQKFLRAYPDEQKFDILVETASAYKITTFVPVVTMKDCILITVAGPNLAQNEISSVAEFTITAKGSYMDPH